MTSTFRQERKELPSPQVPHGLKAPHLHGGGGVTVVLYGGWPGRGPFGPEAQTPCPVVSEVAPATEMAKAAVLLTLFLMHRSSSGTQEDDASQDINFLSELPLEELLGRMKAAERGRSTGEEEPVALALGAPPLGREIPFKGLHRLPARKTFYDDDYEEEKSPGHKKKEKKKIHDILNTSISALSYLAFGGYLLCVIVNALREKRRRVMMAYAPAGGTQTNAQFAHVLQHFMSHKPSRPYIRFPTVTVHQGGRKRRRRSGGNDRKEEEFVSIVHYLEILSRMVDGGN